MIRIHGSGEPVELLDNCGTGNRMNHTLVRPTVY